MDRVLQRTAATASVVFYEDGVAVDPGTVTVGITRADGTVLVAAGTATSGAGAAARTFALTTTHTALLDRLTLTWTSATKGTLVTYVEVVGGFLFSIADARAMRPLDDTATYTSAKLAAARTLAESMLEDECGIAFVPRYSRETINGAGGVHLTLGRRALRSIRSASVGGTALTGTELATVVPHTPRAIYYPTSWTSGFSNVIVGYEHGLDYPPPDVSRACLLLAKHYLVASPIDDRVTTMSNEDGTFSLVTPGVRGAPTGIPEVNATIARYAWPDLVG